ncbi:MAG TPA: MBL fold metallo-hydrolase [Dehalococcoidia bacterium]|nr:MBL fold metallo-hydrolase [Dehalococcoidia bacterium]
MQRVSIGSVEITALLDAPFLQNPRILTPDHADEMAAEYRDSLDDRGLCMGAVTCYLIHAAGQRILVDTGIGPRKRPGFPAGHLDDALREAGVRPDEIDVVVHTHLHTDHIGWNTYDGEDGRIAVFFPRARFVIQQAEWDYWMTPEMLIEPRHAALSECIEPLRDGGRMQFTQGEETFGKHLVFISAPGHTPGHVAIGISDAGERGVIIGDASHHPFHVAHPDWVTPLDWDPVQAAASRDRIFNLAADEQRLVLGGHWKHPGWGSIVRLNSKRSFRAR